MDVSVLRRGLPLWVVRGPVPARARSGVVLQPVTADRAGAGEPTAVALGWQGEGPATSPSGSTVAAVVTQVRVSSSPFDRDGQMPLTGPAVLVTVMRIGDVPAAQVLDHLDRATDHLLSRFAAVEAVAFAKSPDDAWVVELLRATDPEAMRAVQEDPELGRHVAATRDQLSSMEPVLCAVDREITADRPEAG